MPQSIPGLNDQAMAALPGAVRAELLGIHGDPNQTGVIDADIVKRLCEELGDISGSKLMLDLLPIASGYAVVPISDYGVGAVALGATGNLYLGANLEFPGQPLSTCLHAEQSAITNAWVNGESRIRSLAISAPPCGSCRQFMNELEHASELSLITPDRASRLLPELLPNSFGPGNLDIAGGLLRRENHRLDLVNPIEDPTTREALRMANRSYAPYTRSYAGIAIRTQSGHILCGRYAENAAFSPSVSPMQVSLSQLNLSGQPLGTIEEAVLVQVIGAACDQTLISQEILRSVTGVPLRIEQAKPESFTNVTGALSE